jgi:AcrR family transcriptional regulator
MNTSYIIRFLYEPFMMYDAPMATPSNQGTSRPGRPRSEKATTAILEATADLMEEKGFSATTIEAIAARAQVSKVTIYKWWPSRGAVAIDAYLHRYRQTLDFTDTGDVAADLTAQLQLLVEAFRGRAGDIMGDLIGEAQHDPALAAALRDGWLQPRRNMTADVLRHAIERGEIRDDVDVDTLMDQLYAPVYWRLLMRHQSFDQRLVPSIVGNILLGVSRSAG